MADYGHVKISRKAYDCDPFWNEPREFSKWEAWEWMIQEASWKERRRVIGMKIVPLERGEFIASIRFLAEAWGWKRTKVHDFLRLLVEMGRIAGQRETSDGTVYLLVNYGRYQSTPDDEEAQLRTGGRTDSGTQSGQTPDSERTEGGQKRSSKAGKASEAVSEGAREARGRSLPDDWTPNERHVRMAAERGVDVEEEAEKMRDWSISSGKKKRDWDRTFNNWLRNARPAHGPAYANGNHGQPVAVWTEEEYLAWSQPR